MGATMALGWARTPNQIYARDIMSYFILTWNPQKWTGLTDAEWDELGANGTATKYLSSWHMHTHFGDVGPGDTMFLLRQGTDRKGIVAVLRAKSPAFEAPHWNGDPGKIAHYVELEPQAIKKIDDRLPTEVLLLRIPKVKWSYQFSSGGKVSDADGELVLKIWNETPSAWSSALPPPGGSATSAPVSPQPSPAPPPSVSPRMAEAVRKAAIEVHAVNVATDHLEQQGYVVADVGATESWDLTVTKAGCERHIEVKGSTRPRMKVSLTANEVTHSKDFSRTDLVVVDDIDIDPGNHCSGGRLCVWSSWTAEDQDLTPTAYDYDLPTRPTTEGD
jgi:hypothetical protein